ncbi:MAG: HofP DNA utilization family protein, partial [Rhodospirillaceae bacterium]
LVALGAAVATGIAMGFVTVLGRPPAVDTSDRWALPRWAPYVAGPKRDELARAGLWVEEPGKRKEDVVKVAVPPWRFIGTVKDGARVLAVIELEGKKIQRLSPGDALPNGAQIVTIASGEMSYTEDDAQKTLKLFGVTKDETFSGANKKK